MTHPVDLYGVSYSERHVSKDKTLSESILGLDNSNTAVLIREEWEL